MVTSAERLSEIDRMVGKQLQKLMEYPSDRQRLRELLGIDDAQLCNLAAGKQRMRARQIIELMWSLDLPAAYFYRSHPVAAESYPRAE